MRFCKYLIVFCLSIGVVSAQPWSSNGRWNEHRNFSAKSIVSAGKNHTMVIRQGTIWAWGSNASGQLGNNQMGTDFNSPDFVRGINPVIQVAAGGAHSMGLTSDGFVFCWGENQDGQLGDGLNNDLALPAAPAINNAVAVAAGDNHSLALKIDGTVWAWGLGTSGQLGNGASFSSNVPVQVSTLDSIVAIAAGGNHNLALRADGSLWAWGANFDGQLGDASTTNRSTPVEITSAPVNNMIAISCGDSSSYAIRADGRLFSWGSNDNGQLGDGTTTSSSVPDSVPSMTFIESVDAGGNHVLARRADGTLWTWGGNEDGELGDGTTTQVTAPQNIGSVDLITVVSAGGYHSLVLEADGDLQLFGANASGQLGESSNTPSSSPTLGDLTMEGVVMVAAGNEHSLALKIDGNIYSWGYNNRGQLGDGSGSTNRNQSGLVVTVSEMVAVAAGANTSLGLKADGTVWFWGSNNTGIKGDGSGTDNNVNSTPTQVPGLNHIVQINVGVGHVAALSADGSVYTWGSNLLGAIGNGSFGGTVSSPYKVSTLSNIVDLECGYFHTLALDANGQIYTFGGNDYGQLGDGTYTDRNVPVKTSSTLTPVIDLASGWYHSLLMHANGSTKSWGSNLSGQLGNNTSGDSVNVPSPTISNNIKTISAGGAYSKYISSIGRMTANGANSANGVLADSSTSQQDSPIVSQIEDFNTKSTISYTTAMTTTSGDFHALSLQDNWQVAVVGKNVNGQLGTGDNLLSMIYNSNATINCFNPPSPPNAGADQELCDKTTINLNGSLPPANSFVLWTVISGGSTLNNDNIQSPSASSPSTGSNSFEYSISTPGCGTNTDTIEVMVNDRKADAGDDDSICVGDPYSLDANAPLVGTASWSVISGTASVDNNTDPNSSLSTLSGGVANTFQWSMTEGTCPTTRDTVILKVKQAPTTANIAESSQTVCENTTFDVNGNAPAVGSGMWSIQSQFGLSTIQDSDSLSTVVNLKFGWNNIYWTISNGPCPSSVDSIVITAQNNPLTPDAGSNDSICVTSASYMLDGNDPSPYVGAWSVVSGSGSFGDDSIYNTTVTGYSVGTNLYEWKMSNSVCTQADTLKIIAKPLPSNAVADTLEDGIVDTLCFNSSLNFMLRARTPVIGTGEWTVVSPAGTTVLDPDDPNSEVDPLQTSALSTLEWKVTTGQCPVSRDTVQYFAIGAPATSNAGLNDITCDTFYTMNGSNTGAFGSGNWSIAQGCGRINAGFSPTAVVDSLCYGDNILVWTVSNNGNCLSRDSVTITVTEPTELTLIRLDTSDEDTWNTLYSQLGISNIQWFKDSIPISGANDVEYTMTEKCGNYHVEATVDANGGCKGVSDTLYFCALSDGEDLAFAALTQVVPNPTRGEMSIFTSPELEPGFDVVIYSAIGRIVHRSHIDRHTQTIDLSPYVDGMYYVRISQGTRYAIEKVIKR